MRVFHAILLSFGLFTAACATSDAPPTSDDPAQIDDPTQAGDPGASDDDALVSSVASALTTRVAAGCAVPVVCPGTKDCTPYSSFTICSDAISECCGTIGRNSHCTFTGQTLPQNRTRTCVMRATGATCVEIQYRELSGCPTE